VHRTLRWAIVGLLSVAVAFGCSNPDDGDGIEPIDPSGSADDTVDDTEVADEPEAVEDPDPAPDPEPDPPAEIDVTVIPDEITLEYVDAVLIELERLYAEAIVLTMEHGEPVIEASDRLRSAFSSEQYELRLAELYELADSSFAGFAPPDEVVPRQHYELEILDVTASCIWVQSAIDYSGLAGETLPRDDAFVKLEAADKSLLVSDESRTPWVISSLPFGLSTDDGKALECD
jgi:hypothetical protein